MDTVVRMLLVSAVAGALAGCGPSNESEIKQWMAGVRQSVKPVIRPVPAPKVFAPRRFSETAQPDPFDLAKVTPLSARQSARDGATSKGPDLNRRREALENYSLSQLRMVGVLKQKEVFVALIDANGMTHMVRVGNYIGQNFGRVQKISETELQLIELAQDPLGDWVERPAKLELQESTAQPQGARR